MNDIHVDVNHFETGEPEIHPAEQQPYLIERRVIAKRVWNPAYAQDTKCTCGHPYHRHFDGYEGNAAVGCKYCHCWDFAKAEHA